MAVPESPLYILLLGTKRSRFALPDTQIALPREGNLGSDPRLPASGGQPGIREAFGIMSMGFYNGRGVSGIRETIPVSVQVHIPPPFGGIFFQGRQYGTVRAQSGYRGFGLRLFSELRARSGIWTCDNLTRWTFLGDC